MIFIARLTTPGDSSKIYCLYRKVANKVGEIARSEDEISKDYIRHFMQQSSLSGIGLVVDHPEKRNEIIGEIHGYQLHFDKGN